MVDNHNYECYDLFDFVLFFFSLFFVFCGCEVMENIREIRRDQLSIVYITVFNLPKQFWISVFAFQQLFFLFMENICTLHFSVRFESQKRFSMKT